MKKKTITLLGKNKLISHDRLYFHMYKALKWSEKLKRNVNSSYLKRNMTNQELFYHPLWIAKTLVIAGRSPFPPKKIPKMIFVDAISGYRGMLSTVPDMVDIDVKPKELNEVGITAEEAEKYIKDVQEKQINRSYVLKKPDHQLVELSLVHLPLWKVIVKSDVVNKEFIINANTGESEEYMGNFWQESKWMRIG